MLSSDLVKNRGCDANVMDVVRKVAKEALSMNAIEKHHLTRAVIAANLPLNVFAGISVAIHASRETIKFFSEWHKS